MKVAEIKIKPEYEHLVFPLAPEDYKNLEESILRDGVLYPIVINPENVLLDGHHRLRVCQKHGIDDLETITRNFDDDLEEKRFVVLSNLSRRQLTVAQKAELGLVIKDIEAEKAKRRQQATQVKGLFSNTNETNGVMGVPNSEQPYEESEESCEEEKGKALEIAAKNAGVGKDTLWKAEKIKEKAKTDNRYAERWEKAKTQPKAESINAIYTDLKREETMEQEKKAVKPTFNRTNENIEWAHWTWNPVVGCKHGCPYCYARDIANRFYGNFEPRFYEERLDAPKNTKHPNNGDIGDKSVFVCSMADLFGEWVPDEWIQKVIDTVKMAPEWNFLFLTKNPKRLSEFAFPKNAWVGATVDTQMRVDDSIAGLSFINPRPSVLFISCEPLNERVLFKDGDLKNIDWLIIGGRSHSTGMPAFQPEWAWVESLLEQAREAGIMVYFKPNLEARPKEYPKNGY